MAALPKLRRAARAVFAAAVFYGAAAAAQEPPPLWRETLKADSFTFEVPAPAPGAAVPLPHRFIFAGSEVVRSGDEVWARGEDYRIDYNDGLLIIIAPPPYDAPLTITYEYLPFLQSPDYRRALAREDEAEALESLEESRAESQLDITGSKTFSVSSGNVYGTDFDQSLRLTVRGNVGEVKVTGEISDQDVPLEEGGATEDVAALDRISVRVEGRHLAATFGDYDVDAGGLRFAEYERRLTGIKGEAFYPTWRANAYAARARGRFASNEFYGLDGVQGPYQLSAREDEYITILPGTETVWLNGVELKPGDNNDYVFDYDLATVTFTVKRPITSQDRIVVDYQYSTEEYQRDFFGADAEGHFINDALNLGVAYVREDDNRDRDFFGLSEDERERLALAGDDVERSRAVLRDEEGNVVYEYVGEGLGDYTREWNAPEGRYEYTFVGAGNGDYSPKTILLPMPKRQNLFDIKTTLAPARLVTVEAEGATSEFDMNTFSGLDDNDNTGLAGAATTTLRLDALEFLAGAGELEVRHLAEARDGQFQSLGRSDDVAFLQNWDLEDEEAGLTRPPAYNLNEVTVTERPVPTLEVSGTYGHINRRYLGLSAGGYRYHRGDRAAAAFLWEPERWPVVRYDVNVVKRLGERGTAPAQPSGPTATPGAPTLDENTRREQNGRVSFSFWRLRPFVRGYDKKRRADYGRDGAPDSGTIDQDLEVGTGIRPAGGWDVTVSHTEGRGRKVANHAFSRYYAKAVESVTSTYDYPGLVNVSAEFSKTRKNFYDDAEADVDADLSLVDLYYTPLERALAVKTRYQLDNVQDFEREEYFEVAEDGDGDYRRELDPANPGRYIYIYDPEHRDAIYVKKYRYTGRSYRTISPELSAELDVLPYRFNDVREGAARRDPWLDAAALELYVHAGNSSTSPRRFAAATLQDLLGPQSLDSILDQRYTLTLLPVNRRLSGLLRYSKKDELDRTVAPRQQRDGRISRYAEVKTEPARRWALQADVERLNERKSVVEENVRYPQETLATEMIYGLLPTHDLSAKLELKARFELSRRHEDYNGAGTEIQGFKIKPEGTYRLTDSGIVNAWYERTRIKAAGYLGSETLLLRIPGTSHKWEGSVNKGVGKYVTVILTYDGERRPDYDVTSHRGRLDVNIYF